MRKFWSWAFLCALFFSPLRVWACASVSSLDLTGQNVNVTDESAIIVWNAKTKTQHFIRRASFNTKAKDIGFLVPTPNTPQLAEADDNAFYAFYKIDEWMQPKTVYKKRDTYNFMPWIFGGGRYNNDSSAKTANVTASTVQPAVAGGAESRSVTVVAEKSVAGYDAVVLAADNIPSLNRWLREHNYVSTPALMKWLQPYVARRWKITAFKIAKQNNGVNDVSSSAVRMSFKTARPFFPYREPDQKRRDGSRMLRVYCFSNARMTGAINDKLWVGKTVWTDEVPRADLPGFADQLGLSSTQFDGAHLTVLEDTSTTRFAPDDVYFQKAFDQTRIVPPPHIVYTVGHVTWLPIDVIFLLSCASGLLIYSLAKRYINRESRPA